MTQAGLPPQRVPFADDGALEHMTVILRTLGAANRTQAVLLAGRLAREPGDIKPLPDGVE